MENETDEMQEPKREGLGRLTELPPSDIRVLGVLLEKEQTTPEYYPMSLKAIVAACNQKTNREPVMSISEQEALNVLRFLSQEGLVERETGARVDRWRHRLDSLLKFRSAPKALLTVLLLRGAQTAGELRARSDRMHAFESLSQVEETLQSLAAGDQSMIHRLPRQPGQKEDRWVLGLAGQNEPAFVERAAPEETGSDSLAERVAFLEARVDDLEAQLADLRALIDQPQRPEDTNS